jgi:hypothetical protein
LLVVKQVSIKLTIWRESLTMTQGMILKNYLLLMKFSTLKEKRLSITKNSFHKLNFYLMVIDIRINIDIGGS